MYLYLENSDTDKGGVLITQLRSALCAIRSFNIKSLLHKAICAKISLHLNDFLFKYNKPSYSKIISDFFVFSLSLRRFFRCIHLFKCQCHIIEKLIGLYT